MTDELKACPFCGYEAEVEHEEQIFPCGEEWYRVNCKSCDGNSGWHTTLEEAVFTWNSRV